MLRWEWIALVYFLYLAILVLAQERFARVARLVVVSAVILAGLLAAAHRFSGGEAVGQSQSVAVPTAVLLAGDWLSGRFFIRPMHEVERWLLRVDRQALEQTGVLGWYRGAPVIVREYFELAYLFVYPMLPAGAVVLIAGGRADAVDRYWAAVLLAELICYGALPWVQTRPPRAIETAPAEDTGSVSSRGVVRRLNIFLLGHASIEVNTIPSGHAAGAVAAALAVSAVMPSAGAWFAVLAGSIVCATVLGRYHYLADSLLGIAVAVAAWGIVLGVP